MHFHRAIIIIQQIYHDHSIYCALKIPKSSYNHKHTTIIQYNVGNWKIDVTNSKKTSAYLSEDCKLTINEVNQKTVK